MLPLWVIGSKSTILNTVARCLSVLNFMHITVEPPLIETFLIGGRHLPQTSDTVIVGPNSDTNTTFLAFLI